MFTLKQLQRKLRDKAKDDGDAGGGAPEEKKGDKPDEKLTALEAKMAEQQAELDRYKAKHAEAEKHRKEAERKAREKDEESARNSGDVEALEKSWKQKLADREAELKGALDEAVTQIKTLTAGQTATTIASELAISGSAKVLEPHVRSRLGTDYREGKPVTVVLDQDGRPSAMTIDELTNEIRNDPAFAPLIVGSKANGSGGAQGKGAGGANKPTKLSDDPKERQNHWKNRFNLEE